MGIVIIVICKVWFTNYKENIFLIHVSHDVYRKSQNLYMLFWIQKGESVINLHAAWVSMLLGAISGAVTGLFFYSNDFLGGYTSWRRRMVRLGHIAFFGIGLINLAFALSIKPFGITETPRIPSLLLVVAAVTMPLTCYLAAIKPFFRHFFFIPASSVILALAIFAWRIFQT